VKVVVTLMSEVAPFATILWGLPAQTAFLAAAVAFDRGLLDTLSSVDNDDAESFANAVETTLRWFEDLCPLNGSGHEAHARMAAERCGCVVDVSSSGP
jgi:hypothetical protein